MSNLQISDLLMLLLSYVSVRFVNNKSVVFEKHCYSDMYFIVNGKNTL